ncbi:pentapeptide repeat-containing protein [Bradyrhizobium aeschynomenes]|uniref:pentapeptide repeat-containing protein n=1 Tax=Bradyrhizobium aeschynomenes TaxID=2734909 RepID=UPI0015574236|nr:pentapeptide repeat-containing protein [Bradyrhizobium aeschynomenes]NPV19376.1 pentapeptide repeat-containing protein [Bradyrhizobium aeschynomenes]
MKTISYVDEPISRDNLEKIEQLLKFDETNFVRLTKLCNLDRATDFQNLDLTDVDFSNCDLRGYNFSGADLRGAVGVNVIWEIGDPILDNADTSDSLFTHELEQHKYFREHPSDLALVNRLSTDYWANTIIRIDDLLRSTGDKSRSATIARAVFGKHKDPSARSNILLFMRSAVQNSEAHKNFISNILAGSWNNPEISLSGLSAMIAAYGHSRETFNWLLKYLGHPDKKIQKTVFFALLRSSKFPSAFKEIRSYVKNCDDSVMRRAFVGRSTEIVSEDAKSALYNFRDRVFFDFTEILNQSLLIETWSPKEFARFIELTEPGTTKPIDRRHLINRNKSMEEILEAERIREAKLARLEEAFLKRRLDAICEFGQRTELFLKYDTGSKRVELGRYDGLLTYSN